jgi:Uma2 family endonuclease
MTSALPKNLSIENYIAFELREEAKCEYFDGTVVERSPHTIEHARLIMAVFSSISNKLDRKDYEVFLSGLRIKTPAAFPYRYPDVSVVRGKIVVENLLGQDMLVNPLVIVEIASPTTKGSENGERFLAYQSIESFQEYLLVAQDRAHVTRYVRQADNQWVRSDFIGLDNAVELKSLGVTLPLSEIYQGVQFPTITHERNHLES